MLNRVMYYRFQDMFTGIVILFISPVILLIRVVSQVYDVQVTDLTLNLYGKSKPASETQLNSATNKN